MVVARHPLDDAPQAVADLVVRRTAIAIAALDGALGFAGILPGSSIVLGLFTSDPLVNLGRIAAAVALAVALHRSSVPTIRRCLRVIGLTSVLFSGAAFVEPHLFGLLPHGVGAFEAVVSTTAGVTCLVVARLGRRPRRPRTRTGAARPTAGG